MDKADRDSNQALRAEQECRQLLVQFPNSKFAPGAEQQLREIQEVLAESEMRTGSFYHHKGALAAAANRLGSLVDQYPLYSKADEALWLEGDSFVRMGPRFKPKGGEAYQKLVKEYPLSSYTEQAKKKLREMEMEIPAADPAAVARMKFEQENRKGSGLVTKSTAFLRHGPDVKSAAKSGTPAMTNNRPSVPASVPPASTGTGVNDVTIAPAGTGTSALDTQPDARANPTGASAGEVKPEAKPGEEAAATDATTKPVETVADPKDAKKKSKKPSKKPDPKAKQTGNQPPQQ
jgi:outer membrane protein assembly factor BamD